MSNPFENPYLTNPKNIPFPSWLPTHIDPISLQKLKHQLAKLKLMGWPKLFNQENYQTEAQRMEMAEMLRLIESTLERHGCDPRKFSINFDTGQIIKVSQ